MLALASSLLSSSHAVAHGLDAHIASVRVSGDVVYIDATPSTASLAKFDDDHNGLLRAEEVKAHRDELLTFFDNSFRVFDEHDQRGERIFADVSTPHVHDGSQPAGAEHLRFTFRYRFGAEPRRLRVQWFEAERDPLTVHAVRSLASKLIPEQVPLGKEESVKLTALEPAAFLLALPAPLHEATHPGEPTSNGTERGGSSRLLLIGGMSGAVVCGLWWLRRRRAQRPSP